VCVCVRACVRARARACALQFAALHQKVLIVIHIMQINFNVYLGSFRVEQYEKTRKCMKFNVEILGLSLQKLNIK
jgi:hypothetical protein